MSDPTRETVTDDACMSNLSLGGSSVQEIAFVDTQSVQSAHHLEDSAFRPGSRMTLRMDDVQRDVDVLIVRSFLPFTKSQIFLVETPLLEGMKAPESSSSTGHAILKVYDPRYLDDRVSQASSQPNRPWSPSSEAEAAERRREVSRGIRSDDFVESLVFAEEEDFRDGTVDWPSLHTIYEEHFFRLSTECFHSEKAAYQRLAGLQGSAIPRLYASGKLLPPPEAQRAIELPVLLLEYIDGAPLAKTVGLVRVSADVISPLVEAVESLPARGVFHGDVNPGNVMISPLPPAAPTRAVLIDFGCAGLRGEEEDDEAWQMNVNFYGDSRRLKKILDESVTIV